MTGAAPGARLGAVRVAVVRLLLLTTALMLLRTAPARAEVLVRWDQAQVPSIDALGVSTLLIPVAQKAGLEDAARKGYRIAVEVDAGQMSRMAVPAAARAGVVVRGAPTAAQLRLLRRTVTAPGSAVRAVDERGKWPHIRLNWVTRRNDVLQVSSRTEQPWIETNGALIRLATLGRQGSTSLLAYPWTPLTASGMHAGPALENYLVAIAEAGSFGAPLVLPLHEHFQKGLLQGRPDVRDDWQTIRRYLEFYAWEVARRYEPMANIGVVTADPLASFEVLNLLTRHNLPFRLIPPGALGASTLDGLALVIVPETPRPADVVALTAFAERGHTVVLAAPGGAFPWQQAAPLQQTEEQVSYAAGKGFVLQRLQPVADPNAFALQVRDLLGPERRIVDIWNGVTVVVVPSRDPEDGTVLLSLVNYAHEATPVQLRVAGTFSMAQFETPEGQATLLPFTLRNGFTEFVLPALRVGGRVFLTGDTTRR